MSRLVSLKNISTTSELAGVMGIKPSQLAYALYILNPSSQYKVFHISKKNGGTREIAAPNKRLKVIQRRLSDLLLDCVDEINEQHRQTDSTYKPTISHGFARDRSILTNASTHLNQRRVLNIDLQSFFESFHFGRVQGFFLKNHHFKLEPEIATLIAKIACYRGKLPQGSPCSPVITNLITHSLDIRLANLAKEHSCIYTRYADDITFSTRKLKFPKSIAREENNTVIIGKKLRSEIRRAGFEINTKKSRLQYSDSRQDVTGLVVNEKTSVKSEYWRMARAQCNSLFKTGQFTKETSAGFAPGNIKELEGQLNFIDQVDKFNRLRNPHISDPVYKLETHGHNTWPLLHGRERTFSRFLYYRWFYANTKPTILCEGKTDNVYLKSAINALAKHYPKLAKPKTPAEPYKLLIDFLKYSERTRFLLRLSGSSSYLTFFIQRYDEQQRQYEAPGPSNPVIVVLDNDSGADGALNKIKQMSSMQVFLKKGKRGLKTDIRAAEFIHVNHNLYVVLTPLAPKSQPTAIEDLFSKKTRRTKLNGKSFNPNESTFDSTKHYSKEIFAHRVIKADKSSIDFSGFKPLLDRIDAAIAHYRKIPPRKT